MTAIHLESLPPEPIVVTVEPIPVVDPIAIIDDAFGFLDQYTLWLP